MSVAVDHLLSVLAFLLFVLAPVPLGLRVIALQEKEHDSLSLPQALLSLLAVWCVVQAVIAHVLGVLHLLRFPGMLVAEVLVGGAGLMLAPSSLRSTHTTWSERVQRLARIDALESVALLTLSFMGLTLLWWCAAMPVVNWDSWAFHMPHMADWQQTGRFTRMVEGMDRPRNSYPYGWEALCTLFLTPFGEDVLVTFPNLIAWMMFGLASYLLARRYRARRIHALASATLLLAIHYNADPVNTLHVDLPFAALVVTSAYYGLVAIRSGASVPFGLSIALASLACATRVTGPMYAVFLVAWLFLVWRETGFRALPWLRTATLVGLAIGLPLSAFWYVKNLVELGHPLGVGSDRLTGSFVRSNALAFTFNPISVESWRALIGRSFHELEAPFVALVALAALWPLTRVWSQKRPTDSATMLALLFFGLTAVFVITPLSSLNVLQMRLGLALFAALAASAAIGATRAGLDPSVPIAFAVLSAARTFSGSRVLYALMLLAIAWGVWRIRPMPHVSRKRIVSVVCALFVGITALTAVARPRRERERIESYGKFYAYLEQNVPAHEPVAYLLSLRSYLFYGRHLSRAVVYAPLAEPQSIDDWAASLRQQHIRFVLIGPWEDKWGHGKDIAKRLTSPDSPLIAVSGSGAPGEVTIFRLTP